MFGTWWKNWIFEIMKVGDSVKILFSCGTVKSGNKGVITYCYKDGVSYNVFFKKGERSLVVQKQNLKKICKN